jgi:hypothetical protein
VAHDLPGVLDPDAPVQPDHVAPGLGQGGEERRVPGGEVDGGDARRRRGRPGCASCREDRAAVVVRVEGAGPGVEELDAPGPRLHLGPSEGDEVLAPVRHELVPEARLPPHERLGAGALPGPGGLHHVGHEGEGRADEPQDRNVQLLLQDLEGPHHEVEAVPGVEGSERADRLGGVVGVGKDGPQPLLDPHVDPGTQEDRGDVGVEDRAVDREVLQGELRDVGGEAGIAGHRQEVLVALELVVAREGAAGLAHEPDGGAVEGLAAEGTEEAVVHRFGVAGRRGPEGVSGSARPGIYHPPVGAAPRDSGGCPGGPVRLISGGAVAPQPSFTPQPSGAPHPCRPSAPPSPPPKRSWAATSPCWTTGSFRSSTTWAPTRTWSAPPG